MTFRQFVQYLGSAFVTAAILAYLEEEDKALSTMYWVYMALVSLGIAWQATSIEQLLIDKEYLKVIVKSPKPSGPSTDNPAKPPVNWEKRRTKSYARLFNDVGVDFIINLVSLWLAWITTSVFGFNPYHYWPFSYFVTKPPHLKVVTSKTGPLPLSEPIIGQVDAAVSEGSPTAESYRIFGQEIVAPTPENLKVIREEWQKDVQAVNAGDTYGLSKNLVSQAKAVLNSQKLVQLNNEEKQTIQAMVTPLEHVGYAVARLIDAVKGSETVEAIKETRKDEIRPLIAKKPETSVSLKLPLKWLLLILTL